MGRRYNLIGQKFGRLEVIAGAGTDNSGKNSMWLCRCDCGGIISARGQHLVDRKIKSCGCYRKEYSRELGKKTAKSKGESACRRAYDDVIQRAKRDNREMTLTYKEFKVLSKENCVYCGAKPSNIRKSKYETGDYIYQGIDRMNNENGYTYENCVPCCSTCNCSKHTKTIEEWLGKGKE